MKKLNSKELSLIFNFVNVNTNQFIELEHAYNWAKKKLLSKRKNKKNERNKN